MAVQEQSFRYSTTANVYLNSENANGLKITITEGTAYVYVGTEGQPWMGTLAAVNAGESFTVQGLSPTTFLSVSNDFDAFSYVLEFAPVIDPPSPDPEDVVYSVPGNWRCDIAECTGSDWLGSVVNWPSWAAYPNNARTGNNSRTTYGDSGELLYPYMGSWADGCQVNAISGTVLIIEWERGTDVWDETYIYPGQSYVIDLVGAQNGALIEANGAGSAFSVTLENCEPQPLP